MKNERLETPELVILPETIILRNPEWATILHTPDAAANEIVELGKDEQIVKKNPVPLPDTLTGVIALAAGKSMIRQRTATADMIAASLNRVILEAQTERFMMLYKKLRWKVLGTPHRSPSFSEAGKFRRMPNPV